MQTLYGNVSRMSDPVKLLELNDGWTQVPPMEDGDYWFTSAKPWRDDYLYDVEDFSLVTIQGGRRLKMMEFALKTPSYGRGKWLKFDQNSDDSLVWDSECQYQIMAAWRKKGNEKFPPGITKTIFERYPLREKCPACHDGELASYTVLSNGSKKIHLAVCMTCNWAKKLSKSPWVPFTEILRSALDADQPTFQTFTA